MTGMGVELVEKTALPFHGMLFDTVASSGAGALTFPGDGQTTNRRVGSTLEE